MNSIEILSHGWGKGHKKGVKASREENEVKNEKKRS